MAREAFTFVPGETPLPNDIQGKEAAVITPETPIPEGTPKVTPWERMQFLRRKNMATSGLYREGLEPNAERKLHGDNAIKGLGDAVRGQALFAAMEAIAEEGQKSQAFSKLAQPDLDRIEETASNFMDAAAHVTEIENMVEEANATGNQITIEKFQKDLREAHAALDESRSATDSLLAELKEQYPAVTKAFEKS